MKILLTIGLFCCAGAAYAQALFSFEGLTRKDMALVYAGLENRIGIVGYQPGKPYRVLAKYGEISEIDESGYFSYRSRYGHKWDTLMLYVGHVLKGNISLSVSRIPDPEVRLACDKPGIVNKEWVLASPYLIAIFPEAYFNFYLRVTSFMLEVVCGSQKMDYRISGSRLPEDALERISTYKGKVTLYFDDVRFMGGGFCPRSTSFCYELF